jgi:hypothetical protein
VAASAWRNRNSKTIESYQRKPCIGNGVMKAGGVNEMKWLSKRNINGGSRKAAV